MKALIVAALCFFSAVCSLPMPVYGTTRYGRPMWAYRPAPAYYRQPYAINYPEDFYYQDPVVHYPYYAVTRPYAKSDLYQNPYSSYYYNERPRSYGYYSTESAYVPGDETDSLHDTNGRTEALPVGQETWFEGETLPRWQNDYDDVNAAFLQNLMMYNDALGKTSELNDSGKPQESKQQDVDDYDDRLNPEYYGERDTRDFEDEDVRELKALAGKPLYHVPKTNEYSLSHNDDKAYKGQQWRKDSSTPAAVVRRDDDHYGDDYGDEAWINWGSKRNDKPSKQKQKLTKAATMAPPLTTTTLASSTTAKAPITVGGQKEEVLLRPANPVRHPFAEPVMQMLAANNLNKKRTPSVYDTIKQLLSMEESPYKTSHDSAVGNNARVQKRFVTTEEDLVGELKGLKRRNTA